MVVSIYVNPTQFGPKEDLSRYPRDLKRDCQFCRAESVDVVFAPRDAEMYPGKAAAVTALMWWKKSFREEWKARRGPAFSRRHDGRGQAVQHRLPDVACLALRIFSRRRW